MVAFYDGLTAEMSGAAWDGTSLPTCNAASDKLYKHNMGDLSVNISYELPVDYPAGFA